MNKNILALLGLLCAEPALAVEYLSKVEAEVVLAEGMSANSIVSRSIECLKSTAGHNSADVEPATDGDTAYATVYAQYSSGLAGGTIRARANIHGKEGRFKISYTDIQSMDVSFDGNPSTPYMSIAKAWGTGWKKAEESLLANAAVLASCIVKQPAPESENW